MAQRAGGRRYGVELSRSAGGHWRADGLELLAAASRDIAAGVVAHVNLGHRHQCGAGQGRTLWSLGVQSTGLVFLAADVLGDDRDCPAASLGAGAVLGAGVSVHIAKGWQFSTPRQSGLSLGTRIEF